MITTDICKRELDARFPSSLGHNSGGWKRISKTGTASTKVVRVFNHRKLAVVAKVTEQDGAITSVEYTPLGQDGSKPSSTNGAEPVSQVGTAHPTPAPEQTPANGFLFAILSHSGDGLRHFAICPRTYWAEHGCLSDEMCATLQALLPPNSNAEAEGLFCTTVSKKSLRAELLKRGFEEDEEFTDYIKNIW